MIKRIGLFLAALASGFCLGAEARVEVRSLSEARPLFQLPRKYMYAIGVADKTGDRITVLNGRIYVTRAELKAASTKPVFEVYNSMKTVANSLTFANVQIWNESVLKGESRNRTNLGPLLNQMLKDSGYELAGQFPFLIKGKISLLALNTGSAEKPFKFSEKQLKGIIVGFLTKNLVDGVPDFNVDMHFVDDLGKVIAVVDDFQIDAKNKVALFIPR